MLQLPKTKSGNKYTIVFMDYLTKWLEVFTAADETAPTNAKLLVEELISRHGVPNQLLLDRRPSFLSKLLLGVCDSMGVKKINTSVCHPRSNGLVKCFNRTLTNMLAKSVKPDAKEWDNRLPHVLFAYRATLQVSTRIAVLPAVWKGPEVTNRSSSFPPNNRELIELDDYKSVMVQEMSATWDRSW